MTEAGGAGGAVAVAAYVAIVANAIKACGSIIRMEPVEFMRILSRQDSPIVVRTAGGFFTTSYKYLTSYRGLTFYCKSSVELRLPDGVELIYAQKMSIPDL